MGSNISLYTVFYRPPVCSILYTLHYMCSWSSFFFSWHCRDLLPKSPTTQSLARHSTAPGKFPKSQRTLPLITVTSTAQRTTSARSSSRGARTGKPSSSSVQSRCLTTPLVSPYRTVCLAFFSVTQNLLKLGKYVSIFICASYFF